MPVDRVTAQVMNLHWGGTLSQSWAVRSKAKQKRNYTISFPYNYTEYKLSKEKHYWDDFFARNRTANNHSALYANNNFMKKSRMLSDMMERKVRAQSFTTVVVIASIFLFFTLSITVAVVVFCRKKNSVFALQQSEQDDADLEMEELNSDGEMTDTEFESEMDNVRQRSLSLNHLDPCGADSAARRPLVGPRAESEPEDSPITMRSHQMYSGSTRDDRGAYQRMVVTALLEKPGHNSDSEDSSTELKLQYHRPLNKKYYGIAAVSSDIDSDGEGMPLNEQSPVINITYAEDTAKHASIATSVSNGITVTVDRHHDKCCSKDSYHESQAHKRPAEACVLYVNLPTDEKDMPEPGSVICVTMPAKRQSSHEFQKRKRPTMSCASLDGSKTETLPEYNQQASLPSPTPTELLQSPQSICYPFSPVGAALDAHLDLGSPTEGKQTAPYTYSGMKPVKSLPECISMAARDTPQVHKPPPRSESSSFSRQDSDGDSCSGAWGRNSPVESPTSHSAQAFPQSPPKKDIASMFRVSNMRSRAKDADNCTTAVVSLSRSASKPRTLQSTSQSRRPKFSHRTIPGFGQEGASAAVPAAPAPSPATPMEENFVLNMDGGDYCSESEVLVSKDALSLTQ